MHISSNILNPNILICLHFFLDYGIFICLRKKFSGFYVCPLLDTTMYLVQFRYYFFYFILLNLRWACELAWNTFCYSLSEFLRSCPQQWLGEGAGELLASWDSALEEVGLGHSCWPSGVRGGGVRQLSLCWSCALAAGESSSCWSCVQGGTAEEMMPWGAAVEPLLRQFITKFEILTLNVQLVLFLVSKLQSLFTS